MTNFCLDIAQLTNPTRLYLDYLKGGLSDIFRYSFLDSQAAGKVAADIDNHDYSRQELYNIILEGNRRLGASEKTLENIERFKQPATLCVFAGQQTSFCANPMYVIYKALTTVKLARRYEESLSRPVVPCFWMATDDHDFEEVRSANFLERSGALIAAQYEPDSDPAGFPIAKIVLDDGIRKFHDIIDQTLIDTEFKRPLLDSFKEFYSSGKKLSDAFAGVFNKFIGEWGIILVDPNFTGLKDYFKHIYIKEILEHRQTHSLFEQRSMTLLNNGYHAQVHKSGENLNLFYQNPRRLNLAISGDSFNLAGFDEKYTSEELQKIAEKSPDRFSSNVLLRPIAQCAAFPTLCQVVGPSELAYFAQIEPLYGFFDVPFPIIYPRAGMTIIEPYIKKILYKYELDLPTLKSNLEQSIGEVIEKLFPSEAANNMLSLNQCLNKDLDGLAEKMKDSDPEGYQLIIKYKMHLDFELQQLQKKLKTSNKKRHDNLAEQIRRAYAFLFPNGNLQERVISPLYYANKFGPEIFKQIYDSLEVDKPVHSVLEL